MLRRLVIVVATAMLLFGSTQFSAVVNAQSSTPTQQPRFTQHDTSHPVRANYPCQGMKRSGVSKQGSTAVFNCSTQATDLGRTPNDSGGPNNCVNGIAYLQSDLRTGDTIWYSQSGNNISSYIQYYWCPVTSGGSLNWSYGREWPQTGCHTVAVGDTTPVRNYWFHLEFPNAVPSGQALTAYYNAGAGMSLVNGGGITYIDQEPYTPYNGVCSNSYVWDYSMTGNGAWQWQPHMYGYNADSQTWSDANWGWSYYQ